MAQAIFYNLASILIAMLLLCSSSSAAVNNISVNVTILSKNQCRFLTPSTVLDFGILDAANPVDVSTSTTLDFRCQGKDPVATYSITPDDGLHSVGPGAPQMQNSLDTTQYIPYTLSLTPTSGSAPKLAPQLLTINGDILGSDYQFARVGSYADTVTLTILP